MDVRPRTDADLPVLATQLRAVHELDGYPRRWHEPAGRWLTPATMVAAWVAVDGPRLLGHVMLEEEPEVLMVGRLFVAIDARGLGVADALLAVVESAPRRVPLILEVDVIALPAIRRYERRGWTRTGTGDAAWLNADGSPARAHRYAAPPVPSGPSLTS